MPTYEYRCNDCNRGFEYFCRSISEFKEPTCKYCGSSNLERIYSPFALRTETKEFSSTDDLIRDLKKSRKYGEAAKLAKEAGKSEWEIRDLERKAREGK
ncbi:MAG: zinc ribbon domain-containing protein [Candidatus Aenigmarchaeota archaeon]|nr:zinc ribbon domain-containing protein [Candidatus Aenigmarchaeota archaeon]